MSIDLHTHSINSDGTDSIDNIINNAIELQLEAICISDHEYLNTQINHPKIEIISGVEISVTWKELNKYNQFAGIHLLIYFLKDDSPLNQKLQTLRKNKIGRNYRILDNLNDIGVYITREELDSLDTKVPGRPHIAELMVKNNYVQNIGEAFIQYLGNGKIEDLDTHQEDIEEIIKLAIESKSLIFLAHPHTLMSNKSYSKNDNWVNQEFCDYINDLKQLGIHGLEAYYPGYNQSTLDSLKDIAEDFQLLVSGGSDYHGTRKPSNLLGIGYENSPLKVPYELLSRMREAHEKL